MREILTRGFALDAALDAGEPMSGKRTRDLRVELRANLPGADQSDHRAYRKSVRDMRQMKAVPPRPRRTNGRAARKTWRLLCRFADGAVVPFEHERLTRSAVAEKVVRFNSVGNDFWWAAHSPTYDPRSRPRKPAFDGKLAKLSHRRFWG